MMIMLCFSILCALIQSVLCSGTSEVGQVSKTMATSGPILDNILRIERVVNNLTWKLDQTNTEMRKTKTELKITQTNLQNTQNDLVSTKDALKSTEKKLASAMSKLSQVDNMEGKIEEIANMTEKLGSDQRISFQVKLIKRPYTPGEFEPLKFDDVTLNKGGGYNPTSGIFTVPRTGNYLCWANIVSHGKNNFVLRLLKDGKEIVRGCAGGDQAYGTAVITYLKKFNKGEHVWFDVRYGIFNIAGENYSNYGCQLMYV